MVQGSVRTVGNSESPAFTKSYSSLHLVTLWEPRAPAQVLEFCLLFGYSKVVRINWQMDPRQGEAPETRIGVLFSGTLKRAAEPGGIRDGAAWDCQERWVGSGRLPPGLLHLASPEWDPQPSSQALVKRQSR